MYIKMGVSMELEEVPEKLIEYLCNAEEKLSAKDVQVENSEMFGHKTINIIPIYDDKTLEGKRGPASKEDLEKLQKELIIEEKPEEPEEKEEPITDENTWLPKRIP